MLEIEKRAQIQPQDFDQWVDRLTQRYATPQKLKFITILLESNTNHGRLRSYTNGREWVYTSKSGQAGQTARTEMNITGSTSHMEQVIKDLDFTRFIRFSTQRYTFTVDESTRIDLSDHTLFGCFLEFEIIADQTSSKTQVARAEKTIDCLFGELKLQPMTSENYQKHMKSLMDQNSQPIPQLSL